MRTAPTIIGLAGRAGAGKDTAAAHLVARYGFEQVAMADTLKTMLQALLTDANVDERWTQRPLKESAIPGLGISYRSLMQTLGTEWGRDLVGADLWLHVLEQRLGLHGPAPVHDRIVVSDVRFQNEAEWVMRRCGFVLRLTRPSTSVGVAHRSESMADQVTAAIGVSNAGTVEQLHAELDAVMHSLAIAPRD